MGNKTTKTVKVPESKAEEWDQYAEENPEIDSVSHLIRLSVEKEISGEYQMENRRSTSSNGDGGAVTGEVLTALQKIQTSIEDVEGRIDALEDRENAEAVSDLKRAVYDSLPPYPEDATREEPAFDANGKLIGREDEADPTDFALTPEEVAANIGANVEEVADALEEIRSNTGQISRTDTDNGTFYWREA